jgi:hypothetical protein
MSDDDLHDLLARAAGTPPVRLDPSRIRAAEARRRWRRRAGTAGLAALVVVAAVALHAGVSGPRTLVEQPAGPQTSPSAAWRTTTWNDVTWQVPASWHVTANDGQPNAAGPEFFTDGPSMGTIRTGSVCRSQGNGVTGCALGNAVTTWPAEGVLAWIQSASVANPGQRGPGHLIPNVDPGPYLNGLDCTGHGGTVFHSYRILAPGTQDARRVTLNGCVIGPHTATDAALLQQVSDSITLDAPPSPSSAEVWAPASWAGLRWEMPPSWKVQDGGGGALSYPAGAFEDGPYLSTATTGSECHPLTTAGGARGIECSRAIGISTWPTDGVIAWLDSASAGPQLPSGDPGLSTIVPCAAHHGTAFHGYRELPPAAHPTLRMRVDGCLFGPHRDAYRTQLQHVLDSLTLATT